MQQRLLAVLHCLQHGTPGAGAGHSCCAAQPVLPPVQPPARAFQPGARAWAPLRYCAAVSTSPLRWVCRQGAMGGGEEAGKQLSHQQLPRRYTQISLRSHQRAVPALALTPCRSPLPAGKSPCAPVWHIGQVLALLTSLHGSAGQLGLGLNRFARRRWRCGSAAGSGGGCRSAPACCLCPCCQASLRALGRTAL